MIMSVKQQMQHFSSKGRSKRGHNYERNAVIAKIKSYQNIFKMLEYHRTMNGIFIKCEIAKEYKTYQTADSRSKSDNNPICPIIFYIQFG